MNNGDNDNRIRRYTFNDTAIKSHDNKTNTRIWPIIILIIVISALILGGVKTVTYFTSKNDTPTTKTVNKKNDNSDEQNSQQEQMMRSKNNDSSKNNNNSKKDMFAQRHIFSSVADAQNYAKATQDQWLKAGYQTYTVSADSQGYYILRFVK